MSKTSLPRIMLVATALASVISASACMRRRQPAAAPAPNPSGARATAAQRDPRLTDGGIAAILLAANNTDISYARLAPARARSQAVKDFAQRMLTDHSAVNKAINDVLATSTIVPEDNVMSLDFRDESAAKRDILRDLEGRAFDSTYMANEVSYHTKLLASIDQTLMPSAVNPQLRQLIGSIRPAVAAHLSHAQQVRAAVTGGK